MSMAEPTPQELPGVVDEEGGDADPPLEQVGAPSSWDLDKICAYETYKVVTIKDRFLGALYWGTVATTVLYITIVAFHMDGRHQEFDPGVGTVFTRFQGKAAAAGNASKVFDVSDLRFPVVEPSGAFLATRQVAERGQRRGGCVDWDNPRYCGDGSPCPAGGTCNGVHCEVPGWCPSLGDGNVDPPPPGAEVLDIVGLEDTVLRVEAGISFPYAGDYLYVADSTDGKNAYANITLGDLLASADPPLRVADLSRRGALIGVSFLWNCDLTTFRTLMGDRQVVPTGLGEKKRCPYHVVVERLDTGGQGFVHRRASHRRDEGGVEVRDAVYMYGLRIIVESAGLGRRVSIVLIVIQFGSMFSLLKMASQFADYAMLNLMCDQDRGKFYYKCKVIETKDYSDLQDRLVQVHLEREARLAQAGPRTVGGGGGAAARAVFGLGAGGRGGSGSAILRGRAAAGSGGAAGGRGR